MFECAMQIDGGEGVLLIIKNYTGDILNFETATELLHESGVKVTTMVVDDDVAVKIACIPPDVAVLRIPC